MELPQIFVQILLPVMLAIMMFSMGLSLTLADFKRTAEYPELMISGVLMQLLLLPVLAWGLILFVGLFYSVPTIIAFGILILAACPGGATSNVISHLSGGDSALSVSMTAIVSLLVPFIVPFSLAYQLSWLGGDSISIQLPIIKTVLQLMVVTIIPVLMAMLLRHYWSDKIIRIEPFFRQTSGIIFILLVFSLLIIQWPKLKEMGALAAGLCLALCLLAMATSYLIAKIQEFSPRVRKTLSIEVGIQNAGTGIFIAAVLLNNPELALIPLTYGLVMNIPALILIALNYSKNTATRVGQIKAEY